MTYLDPETQSMLNRQRVSEEMQNIHLQNKALRGRNLLSRGLASLGEWMIARGEKMRIKNSTPQARYTALNEKAAHH